MKRSISGLLISITLFAAWLGFLAVQARQFRFPPVIVSRAQLLAAQYDVIADLALDDEGRFPKRLTVKEVLFAADPAGPESGQTLEVVNLDDCVGFTGAGTYILPLARSGHAYRVPDRLASQPRDDSPLDPGAAPRSPDGRPLPFIPPSIYPLAGDVRRQFQEIRAGRAP